MKWSELNGGYEPLHERLKRMTPHEILGVAPGADMETIRYAYRRRISLVHPDKSSMFMLTTDQEVAKLINAAYESLMKGFTRE